MLKYGREYKDEDLIFDEPIWFFVSIWSSDKLSKVRANNNITTLKELFDLLPQIYYYNRKTINFGGFHDIVILSAKGYIEQPIKQSLTWKPISNYDAYLTFGIVNMEEAIEKTSSTMSATEFIKITRKIKMSKIGI